MKTIKEVLVARGFRGRLLAHVMPWFSRTPGQNYHPVTPYDSGNPLTIGRQLTAMQAGGVDGVIVTYQGPGAIPPGPAATVEMSRQCAEREMLFGLLMDPWAAKIGGPNKEKNMSVVLNHPDVTAMLASPAYLPEGYLLDFATGVDWKKVLVPAFGGKPRVVLGLNTGYAWSHDQGDVDPIVSLKDTYSRQKIVIGALVMSFFDGGALAPGGAAKDSATGASVDFNKRNWGTGELARMTPDRAGNYFWDQVDSQPLASLPYMALETWNDYNERTAWEPWFSAFTGERIR